MEHKDFVFNSSEQNAALVWIHWVNEHESFGRRRMVHLQVLCVTGSEQQFVKNALCKTKICFQKRSLRAGSKRLSSTAAVLASLVRAEETVQIGP